MVGQNFGPLLNRDTWPGVSLQLDKFSILGLMLFTLSWFPITVDPVARCSICMAFSRAIVSCCSCACSMISFPSFLLKVIVFCCLLFVCVPRIVGDGKIDSACRSTIALVLLKVTGCAKGVDRVARCSEKENHGSYQPLIQYLIQVFLQTPQRPNHLRPIHYHLLL